jgi:hypothetical protein
MKFVLRMAARELRASLRRLLFFFVSIAVGVGAMISLGSVIQSVRAALMKDQGMPPPTSSLADRPWRRYIVDEKLRKHRALRPRWRRPPAARTRNRSHDHGRASGGGGRFLLGEWAHG